MIVDHGGQPMAMFKYACFKKGVDVKALSLIDAGSTEKMIAAFRKGDGDYVHLQGPGPQQLEHDGVGHVVAALADASGTCAFSSLAATREWLGDRHGQALHARLPQGARLAARHARRRGRQGRGAAYFKDIDPAGADRARSPPTRSSATGRRTWRSPSPPIEAALDIFQHAGLITKRHAYADVVARRAAPPA